MGHSYSGNLDSFYLLNKNNYKIKYLTFEKKLAYDNSHFSYYINLKNIIELLNCKLIISSHGILFHRLVRFKNIKTINIGHGVQTAIEDLSNSYQLLFDEVWLSSQLDKETIIKDCGYTGQNMHVTGYLLHQRLYKNQLNKSYPPKNINKSENYILYAPSASSFNINNFLHPLFLYNVDFLDNLDAIAKKFNYKIIIKPHIKDYKTKNFDNKIYDFIKNSKNLIYFKDLQIEEYDLVFLADILLTDWSSIYLDFLVLDKNIIFLNSPKIGNNYNSSKFLENEFIERCVTYDEVYKNIERIKDNPVRQSTTDLKHMIFGDLDFLEINTNYNTRLKSI
jgi:hypothetical protein